MTEHTCVLQKYRLKSKSKWLSGMSVDLQLRASPEASAEPGNVMAESGGVVVSSVKAPMVEFHRRGRSKSVPSAKAVTR